MLAYTAVYLSNVLYAVFNLLVLPKVRNTPALGGVLILFELAYPFFLATVATMLSILTTIQGHGPVPFVMAMLVISIVLQGQYVALLILLITSWVCFTLGLYLTMPMVQAAPPVLTGFTTILIAAAVGRLTEQLRVKQFESMEELANKNQLLEKLSIEDSLTKLYNRRHFNAKLQQETTRSQRYSHPLGLLMIDIDDFKHINDNVGHVQGDNVLIQVAKLITAELRSVDVVCRYGGDEFVVLLVEASASASLEIAKRICSQVSQHHFTGVDRQVTTSIGHTQLNGQTTAELLQQADKMLYVSKRLGKNRVSSESHL
jgi:diguanylate cyclase (GGDEF)-like protein